MTSVPESGDRAHDPRTPGFRTFLIADVRGYTSYTREHGDEAAAALAAEFATAVRDVVGPREGFLLELRGDEALVVFESPRQALRAAVDLQKKFRDVGLVRGVGIGLDAGEAVPVEGGYRGGALNLAARLCSQAGPGEILASEAVIHLAARIDGVEYVDARTLHLKGFPQPIRAVEVAEPGSVRRGLSRRVRRLRAGVQLHSRLALASAGGLVALAIAVLFLMRPELIPFMAGPSPSAPPTLADLDSGVAIIDPSTGEKVAVISRDTVKEPADVAYAQGSFWVLNLEPLSLVQVDPTTGAIGQQFASPVPDMGGWVTDGRRLWVADYVHPVIVRLDIASGREVDRMDLSDAADRDDDGFAGLALGDGSLWVTTKGRRHILRIDPDTGAVQADIRDVTGSWAVAFGDAAVWTGDFSGVSRIDPATNTAERTDVPGGQAAQSIAIGGGFAWTQDESKGVVYKIDQAGQIDATIATGLGARALSFSDGTVWVGNQDVGTVTGIDAVTGAVQTLTFGHPVVSVAAGEGRLMVVLGRGKSYEDRINALTGKVARLHVSGYEYDPPETATQWNREAWLVEGATCARLVRYARQSTGEMALEPEVATDLPAVSEDGLTYTFQIRPGFAFSPPSEEKVTADTFRYTIERALNPKLASDLPGSFFLADVKGLKAFQDGLAAHISGLVADGDHLSITLTAPSDDLVSRLTVPFFCPVPTDTPIVVGGALRRTATDDGPAETVPSAGPYYVADRNNGEYLILERNPNWPGDPPQFDAIALREGVNAGVAVERVESGDWDGIVELYDQVLSPTGELASRAGPGSDAAGQGMQAYYPVPDGGVYYIGLNAGDGPLKNAKLRQAVSLAINRRALVAVEASDYSQGLPWDSLLPPSMLPRSDLSTPDSEPDIEAARALVGDAAGTQLRLVISSGCDECGRVAEEIARDLKAIGLRVRLKTVENSYDAIHEPNAPYDMKFGWSGADTDDAGTFLLRLLTEDFPPAWQPAGSPNATRRLSGLAAAERQSEAIKLADDVRDNVPVVVFGYSLHGAYFGPSVGCIDFDPLGALDLRGLCPAS